jgi:hypothetical protein
MNKVERVRAALRGVTLDHPPITVWYHFGLQHAPAEKMAAAHLEFLDAYDLDWLKVMNDYSYPMPKGLDVIATAADLRRIEPLDPVTPPMGEQLRVIAPVRPGAAGGDPARGRALGGGTVRYEWNRDALRGTGLTVLLEVDLAVLAERVRGADRPRVNPGVTLEEDLARLWASAETLYRKAANLTYRTDTGLDVDAEAAELARLLKGRGL